MGKVAKSKWTENERFFDQCVTMSESPHQLQRIKGRMMLIELEKRVGKEEMDRMWENIK